MSFVARAKSNSGFGWHGGLSLAPLVTLIAVGVWLVLREHRIVQQDTRDAKLEAATSVIEYLEKEMVAFSWLRDGSPLSETSALRASPDILVVTLDASGQGQESFSTSDSIPLPKPFAWEQLDETAIHLWEQSQQGNHPTLAIQAVVDFLAVSPSERLNSLARFRHVVLLMEQSRWRDAAVALHSLQTASLEDLIYTESGLPLSVVLDFCELDLAEKRFDHEGRVDSEGLDAVLGRQWTHPSPWTVRLVDRCAALEQQLFGQNTRVNEYLSNVALREKAWRRYVGLLPSTQRKWQDLSTNETQWIDLEGKPYVLSRVSRDEFSSVYFAIPSSWFEQAFNDALQRWGDLSPSSSDFHFSIYVDRQRVFGSDSLVADAGRSTSDFENNVTVVDSVTNSWFGVGVALADPELFSRRSRERMLSVFALIGLASITGLVGWGTQYRAYQRQVELGLVKSNFVASVSHELRTPIASIRLLTENLLNQDSKTEVEKKEYFQWIGLECRRLGSLVENVLQFSRLEHGKREYVFEPVDICRLFEETLKFMKSIADHAQVQVSSDIRIEDRNRDETWPDAFWDGQAVHQALVNMLENAIKHTPAGGEVGISMRLKNSNQTVEVSVSDQGKGIDLEDRERIFLPFERLGAESTRKTSGVGIGLSLVRHAAEAHGGSVRVVDSTDGGACFVLLLPLDVNEK